MMLFILLYAAIGLILAESWLCDEDDDKGLMPVFTLIWPIVLVMITVKTVQIMFDEFKK